MATTEEQTNPSNEDQISDIRGANMDMIVIDDLMELLDRRVVHVVVDLQYGSTGKGLLCAQLGLTTPVDTIVTAWAPNAGHTAVVFGDKLISTMLPSGVFNRHERGTKTLRRVMFGPGSILDLDALCNEYMTAAGFIDFSGVEFIVHRNAVIIDERHREAEKTYNRIGSTMKGCGAALIEKIERDPSKNATIGHVYGETWVQVAAGHGKIPPLMLRVVDNSTWLETYDRSKVVLVEGAQGYGLSINHGTWPYTTSRDCTTARTVADCGIPYPKDLRVWGVARTLPIRVANRYDEDGGGSSGPCENDQHELTWDDLGFDPEYTTVTKKKRRIFTFSDQQFRDALNNNGVDFVFLNFVNYLGDEPKAVSAKGGYPVVIPERERFVGHVIGLCAEQNATLMYLGFGPDVKDLAIKVG